MKRRTFVSWAPLRLNVRAPAVILSWRHVSHARNHPKRLFHLHGFSAANESGAR